MKLNDKNRFICFLLYFMFIAVLYFQRNQLVLVSHERLMSKEASRIEPKNGFKRKDKLPVYSFFGTRDLTSSNFTEDQVEHLILNQFTNRNHKNFVEIKKDINIKKNLIRTEEWPFERKWFVGDTSCPFQIRSTLDAVKREKRRLPDAISIGIAKCGTGSLVGFSKSTFT